MKTLYYAHSKRIYGSRQEKRELKLIKKKFPECKIINPGEITFMSLHEEKIMEECRGFVRQAAVVVCSEYKKHIGRGVFEELSVKTKAKKYLLRGKKFIENFSVRIVDRDDWCVRYGKCEIKKYEEMRAMKKYWKIKMWVEVDEEIPDVWDDEIECAAEIHHLQSMQPENRYECIDCDENGEEV